ncbi:hypothetical protein YC2023_050082 [Brassica napus]
MIYQSHMRLGEKDEIIRANPVMTCSFFKNLCRGNKHSGCSTWSGSSANGHVKVVKALLASEPAIAIRMDKKGQTALHIAAKGTNVEVVEELINADRSSINIADTKGNTALHIADRKGRSHIVKLLLDNNITDTKAVNRTGEMALDTAEKVGNPEVALILQKHGVPSAKTIKPSGTTNPARELKQTVSDIKHEVHNQLEHTRQTRRRVQGIAKQLNKMHTEGLNNAINSTTVVAVLIATVAFAAIFTVPGQYVEDTSNLPDGHSLGEANIASTTPFIIFFIFDFIALFISLAVVVVQTSVVVIESKAKKQMMAVINRLACVLMRSHLRFEEDLNLSMRFRKLFFERICISGVIEILLKTRLFKSLDADPCKHVRYTYELDNQSILRYMQWTSHAKDYHQPIYAKRVGSNTFYPDFSHRFEEQEVIYGLNSTNYV